MIILFKDIFDYFIIILPLFGFGVKELSCECKGCVFILADWGGCPDTRRSSFGYCVLFVDNLLSWSSKHQAALSHSNAKAKYQGVADVVFESCWLCNLLLELHFPIHKATLVYCDNVSAIYLSGNPIQHQHTKHIEMDIHFVREKVAHGQVRVLHVPLRYQIADIFTKGLPLVYVISLIYYTVTCLILLKHSTYLKEQNNKGGKRKITK